MKQVLVFGASITHGVGGENGGWADKLKAAMHKEMFGAVAAGERNEIYELGVSGETLPDVQARLETEIHPRIRGNDPENVFIVLAAGLNDSKAVDAVDNHLSTPDDYAASLHSFIHLTREYSNHLLVVGLNPVDESKTNPKSNPITGGSSYFSNDRIKVFEETMRGTCEAEDVSFVPMFSQAPSDWQQNYLYSDGVHPNDAGHQWIFEQIWPRLQEMMKSAND